MVRVEIKGWSIWLQEIGVYPEILHLHRGATVTSEFLVGSRISGTTFQKFDFHLWTHTEGYEKGVRACLLRALTLVTMVMMKPLSS